MGFADGIKRSSRASHSGRKWVRCCGMVFSFRLVVIGVCFEGTRINAPRARQPAGSRPTLRLVLGWFNLNTSCLGKTGQTISPENHGDNLSPRRRPEHLAMTRYPGLEPEETK